MRIACWAWLSLLYVKLKILAGEFMIDLLLFFEKQKHNPKKRKSIGKDLIWVVKPIFYVAGFLFLCHRYCRSM